MATVPDVDESILEYKGKTFTDYMKGINDDLEALDRDLNKEMYQAKKPDSFVGRVFTDLFGVLGLYIMLFILADFTRVVLTGGSLYGIKWLFWGPYYYLTDAPLLTRIWESKKFLKDLAEVENNQDFAWPEDKSCTDIGNIYQHNCQNQTVRNHPIKDKMGDGLDWLIRHTIGKSFGGILGNGDCEDQGTTIAHDCAVDKVQALHAAYVAFCNLYPDLINIVGDVNAPNTPGGDPSGLWGNEYSVAAYQMYYDGYLRIFDIGIQGHGSDDYPENLNPMYDDYTFYCFNAAKLWGMNGFGGTDGYSYLNFPIPAWYWSPGQGIWGSTDYKFNQMYFQLNYKDHIYDP